jgi:hypothetical protein
MSSQLDRLLFLQANKCFFCEASLPSDEASVEHLVAVANGGTNTEANCVACCKTINRYLGSLPLKDKLKVIIQHQGKLVCPRKNTALSATQTEEQKTQIPDDHALIELYLKRLKKMKPDSRPNKSQSLLKDVSTKCQVSAEKAQEVIEQLVKQKIVQVSANKVTYPTSMSQSS